MSTCGPPRDCFHFLIRYRRFWRESSCVSCKSPCADSPPFALELALRAQTKALGGGCLPGDSRRKPHILPSEIAGISFCSRNQIFSIHTVITAWDNRAHGSTAQARQRQLNICAGWLAWVGRGQFMYYKTQKKLLCG